MRLCVCACALLEGVFVRVLAEGAAAPPRTAPTDGLNACLDSERECYNCNQTVRVLSCNTQHHTYNSTGALQGARALAVTNAHRGVL